MHDDPLASPKVKLESWKVWLYSILANLTSSMVSLCGIVFLRYSEKTVNKWLKEMLGLACGTLLGAVTFTLLPETAEMIGGGVNATITLLSGILFAFFANMILHSHGSEDGHGHAHGQSINGVAQRKPSMAPSAKHPLEIEEVQNTINRKSTHTKHTYNQPHEHRKAADVEGHRRRTSKEEPTEKEVTDHAKAIALNSIMGDILHNAIDGALLGATFSANIQAGLMATLAIALHELPQEMADYAILIQAGYRPTKALLVNFLVSLSAVAGCIISLLLGRYFDAFANYALPFASGQFLYLALALLVPILMDVRDRMQAIRVVLFMCVGIGLMALSLLLPHSHAHGDEASDAHGHGQGGGDHGDHSGHNH